MLISEITDGKGQTRVVARIDADARLVNGADSVYALALEAARAGESLRTVLDRRGLGEAVDLAAAYEEGRLNTPISHPDPAHLHITGTGLTHLGSAATRDSMHKKLTADGAENLTDSMKMFRMGLESGKPARGEVGVQPEWFYKGNGVFAVAPGKPLGLARFREGRRRGAGDRRHLCDRRRRHAVPGRLRAVQRVLRPRHRARQLSLPRPQQAAGTRRSGRRSWSGRCPTTSGERRASTAAGKVLWEKPFLSGEANMSHSIANLEHHHFKYGPVPAAGRRACPHVRDRDAVVRRRHQDRSQATSSRSRRRRSACRCAIRWRSPSRRRSRCGRCRGARCEPRGQFTFLPRKALRLKADARGKK